MPIKIETIKKYIVVHTWTGIIASIVLFIAFYAGALAIFKAEIAAWTRAEVVAPTGSNDIDALAAAFFTDRGAPSAQRPVLVLPNRGDPTARIFYSEHGQRRTAYLDRSGELQTVDDTAAGNDVGSGRTVGDFVDDVHRAGGLPLDVETAEPIIGIISLLYGVALVSGVVVLLPSLVKDLFLLRITHNVRRMWLDAHNMLALTSLPFHVVMALTAAVFGLHHFIYDTQDLVIYPKGLAAYEAERLGPSEPAPAPTAAGPKPPTQLLSRLRETAPAFEPTSLRYMTPRGAAQPATVRINGTDDRHFLRDGRVGLATLDLATGQVIDTSFLPGRQTAMGTTLTSFFALHFGNFGGLPVRLLYIVLGLLGCVVFYSGNLLWVESRLKKVRPGNPPARQPRHLRWVASLTVGACLGCVAGLSASMLAVRWLGASPLAPDLLASCAYHGVFVACILIAFIGGAARAAFPLLALAAMLSALIPVTSMMNMDHGAGTMALPPTYWLVDGFFTLAAVLLSYLAYRARRRYRTGPRIFPGAVKT